MTQCGGCHEQPRPSVLCARDDYVEVARALRVEGCAHAPIYENVAEFNALTLPGLTTPGA